MLCQETSHHRFLCLCCCCISDFNILGSGLGDHVTSYCLVLMVIFFLQIQGILHTVTTLQSVPGLEEVLVNDFNFSFCTDSSKLPPLPTSGKCSNFVVVELLHGFFKFFADFDYNGNSICLKQGRPAARFNVGVGLKYCSIMSGHSLGGFRLCPGCGRPI